MRRYTTPNVHYAALVTLDMQADFALPGAPAETTGTLQVVPRVQQVVQAFRTVKLPIFHTVRLYLADGSNADLCRREDIERGQTMVQPGTDGAELMPELKPRASLRLDAELLLQGNLQQFGPQEWVLYKPRWGAFFRTALEDHLHALNSNTVVVCGSNFPNCPRTTLFQASERDFRLVFVPDATSGVYERGLRELANIGVDLMSTAQCVAWLQAAT